MNKISIALLAIIAFSVVGFAGDYDRFAQINLYNGCQVKVSIKVLSEFSDDEQNAQIRYKYSKENCAEKILVSFTGLTGGDLLYKKKRKNIYLKSDSHNSIETGFNFKVSQKIGEYTKSENVHIGIEMGTSNFECDPAMEALGICNVDPELECDSVMEALGICTNSVQVDIAVSDMFSVNEKYARIEIIVDKDNTIIDSVQIISMVFEGDVIIRNNDNDIAEFPEEANNDEQWELETTSVGSRKLLSFTYKVNFINNGDEDYKEPIYITNDNELDLGIYTD